MDEAGVEGGHPLLIQAMVNRIQAPWPAMIWCDQGWWPVLARLEARLAQRQPDYVLLEIKEKWGGLKVHTALPTDADLRGAFRTAIEDAQREAARTCEVCGQPGRLRMRPAGKVRTVCDEHGVEYRVLETSEAGRLVAESTP